MRRCSRSKVPIAIRSVGGSARASRRSRGRSANANWTSTSSSSATRDLPDVEEFAPGVTLRRWSQWISAYHPRNVYDGEEGKVNDFRESVPRFVASDIVAAAASEGAKVLVVAEEWQTADALIRLDAILRATGLRGNATLLWNANNTYGFERIDWGALQRAAAITTVSKYMKFELALARHPSLVVPNGIDEALLDGPPQSGDRNATRRPARQARAAQSRPLRSR
jgi:hypothetical protein